MRGLKFAIAVAATSLALVAVVAVAGLLIVRSAFASTPLAGAAALVGGPPWAAGAGWFAGHGAGGTGFQLPPELQGLASLPADQRFAHFEGVQVNLKDKDNKPLTVNVTPGTVTAASATSLSITANDDSAKTFTINSSTTIHGMPARGSTQSSQPSPANGDKVIVVTLNNDTTAMAVIDGGQNGFAGGPRGPWGWGH